MASILDLATPGGFRTHMACNVVSSCCTDVMTTTLPFLFQPGPGRLPRGEFVLGSRCKASLRSEVRWFRETWERVAGRALRKSKAGSLGRGSADRRSSGNIRALRSACEAIANRVQLMMKANEVWGLIQAELSGKVMMARARESQERRAAINRVAGWISRQEAASRAEKYSDTPDTQMRAEWVEWKTRG